jgi:SAM-dependent methyltransferase
MEQKYKVEYEKTVSGYYQEYEKEIYDYIYENINYDSMVLELGSGKCNLLERLNKDYIVTGIDNNKKLVEYGRNKNLIIHDMDLEKDLTMLGSLYDVILILQVLEHLEQPIKVLNDCKKILRHEGRIIISVPNVHFMTRIINTSLYIDEYKSGHINAYDKTQLKVIIEKYCDYEIEKMFFSGQVFPNMKGIGKMLDSLLGNLKLFKRFSRRITCIIKNKG